MSDTNLTTNIIYSSKRFFDIKSLPPLPSPIRPSDCLIRYRVEDGQVYLVPFGIVGSGDLRTFGGWTKPLEGQDAEDSCGMLIWEPTPLSTGELFPEIVTGWQDSDNVKDRDGVFAVSGTAPPEVFIDSVPSTRESLREVVGPPGVIVMFVADDWSNSLIYSIRSTDHGASWSAETLLQFGSLSGLPVWTGTYFFVSIYSSGVWTQYRSTDGASWVTVPMEANSIVGAAGGYVYFMSTGQLRRSQDGTVWGSVGVSLSGSLSYPGYVLEKNGVFLTKHGHRSTDGISFQYPSGVEALSLVLVLWWEALSKFIAYSENTQSFYESADGITWSNATWAYTDTGYDDWDYIYLGSITQSGSFKVWFEIGVEEYSVTYLPNSTLPLASANSPEWRTVVYSGGDHYGFLVTDGAMLYSRYVPPSGGGEAGGTLLARKFNAAVPLGATITGVRVRVDRRTFGGVVEPPPIEGFKVRFTASIQYSAYNYIHKDFNFNGYVSDISITGDNFIGGWFNGDYRVSGLYNASPDGWDFLDYEAISGAASVTVSCGALEDSPVTASFYAVIGGVDVIVGEGVLIPNDATVILLN